MIMDKAGMLSIGCAWSHQWQQSIAQPSCGLERPLRIFDLCRFARITIIRRPLAEFVQFQRVPIPARLSTDKHFVKDDEMVDFRRFYAAPNQRSLSSFSTHCWQRKQIRSG